MRQRAERAEAYSGGNGHVTRSDIKEAAKDVKSWIHGCIQIAVVTILYGFGTFLPIIIRYGFQYSAKQVRNYHERGVHDRILKMSRHNILWFQ